MPLTQEEHRYLQCLADQMSFEEMAVEPGWTYHEVVDFGQRLFGRNGLMKHRREETKHYRLLPMRACKMPEAWHIIKRYEETGDNTYFAAFAHMILDRRIDRVGVRAKLEESRKNPN